MKKISTLLLLALVLSMFNKAHSQAQEKWKINKSAYKQKFDQNIGISKGQLQQIMDAAKKQGHAKPAARPDKPFDFKSLTKNYHNTTSKTWTNPRLFVHKKSTATSRPKPSAARKSGTSDVPAILYVRKDAVGAGDGSNWDNAFNELADALKYASGVTGVEEIWVAFGEYYPLYDHEYKSDGDGFDPRNKTFMLLRDVKIYGGFYGTENSLNERQLMIKSGSGFVDNGYDVATILHGDMEVEEEGATVIVGVHHVVTSVGNVGSALLDGVVIAYGNADNEEPITIQGQEVSRMAGGGIVLYGSSPILQNLLLSDNKANIGGAIAAFNSDFVMTNATIDGNFSEQTGSVYISNSSPVITNATITNNLSKQPGAGIFFDGAATSARIRNTIIWGNRQNISTNNVYRDPAASVTFLNSLVEGSGGSSVWDTSFGQDAGGNIDTDPRFRNINYLDYTLRPGSPAINAGTNAIYDAGQTPDLSGIALDSRGVDRISAGTVDMGALESLYGIVTTTLTPNSDGVLFVKKGNTGNGSSWADAAGEVADALVAAQLETVKEIWVAGGTYFPLYRPDNLSGDDPKSPLNSFSLVEGTTLYGGFAGTEGTLAERDRSRLENASILSGDFNQDDDFDINDFINEGPDLETENAFVVVSAVSIGFTGAAVDGFTIEGGNDFDREVNEILRINEVQVPGGFGSGVLTFNANVSFVNTVIRNNVGLVGGGLASLAGAVSLVNSAVYHNATILGGSGVFTLETQTTTLFNTTVSQNVSVQLGAGIFLSGSGLTGFNVISYDNILLDNDLDEEGNPYKADFYAEGSGGILGTSIVGGSGGSSNWQLSAYGIQDAGGNLDEDPSFTDPENDDFSLTPCSRAIDAGYIPFPPEFFPQQDVAGNPRFFNETLDIGAYESQQLQSSGGSRLAASGKKSAFEFMDNSAHTFTAEVGVCSADLLTMAPGKLTGEVIAKVWTDQVVNSFNGAYYVQRHYDIIPVNEVKDAGAQITLYFTQAEFDAFNARVTSTDYLPTGNASGEAARKANFRIYQFHGDSFDGSGEPDSYGDDRGLINPDDDNIVWNAALSRWEVTFPVMRFSGFFAGTAGQNPLPVRLISFEGKHQDDGKVGLNWKVTEQEKIAVYQVEYSENGKSFNKIGAVAANTLSTTAYNFTDSLAHEGDVAYYRLKIFEADGSSAFSKIISIKLPETNRVIAYPIPAKNELWIDWKKSSATFVEFVDVNGKKWKTVQKTAASQKVNISELPAGLILLKAKGSNAIKVVKE
ncbi:choice-of-anchor Q domain-containing protein [Dyadobacter luticola]|uniref:Secretion system C-terminal sorting domain-containing protein n=1 Tax=Dyadobacter luticola TaxID=1979387 RepID=A0A5R9L5H9_9BACT|nr:choice-of-anchor Q domain-containing protein [Dyadobacter luticola]TLV03505.1 hypothetical protein FEN17_07835 [Dyadobacter luticola]